jgi:Ca2+-binding EF-hand superfamily protein
MTRATVVDAMFDALDTSGDGSVSRAEVARAVRASPVLAAMLGIPRVVSERADTVGEFNAAFDGIDADHDGRISRAEMHAFVLKGPVVGS